MTVRSMGKEVDRSTEAPESNRQDDVFRFLMNPAAYGDNTETVEVVRTHGATVFLGKTIVYKVKNAVDLGYLDFSTLAKRKAVCERELALNRQFAPQIYEGLAIFTEGEDGTIALAGEGAAIEYAVKMKRYGRGQELSVMAETGRLDRSVAIRLGEMLSNLHKSLQPVDNPAWPDLMLDVLEHARIAFEKSGMAGSTSCTADLEFVTERIVSELTAQRELIATRAEAGFVRHCHGDLHLGNIVLLGGAPTPFDALEFNDNLARTDVVYDACFLFMDMIHRGLAAEANLAFNRYVLNAYEIIKDGGFRLLPIFMSVRAIIRAMASAERAAQLKNRDLEDYRALCLEASAYLTDACSALNIKMPGLVAVGGLSGTGKSTIAAALATDLQSAPGALHIRSDLERKALFGVPELEPLPKSAYDRETGERVYQIMTEKAETALSQGRSVVLDAVHLRREERDAVEELARRLNVPFVGLWLSAPAVILHERVISRKNDASDADSAVLNMQLEAVADGERSSGQWQIVDASGLPATVLSKAKDILAQAFAG
ncbi:MAG: AAA family ATPase [Pseudomonadota bacterium]